MEPLLHADETGIRINGTNGFIWMVGNNRFRIFLHRTTRSSKEIQLETREILSSILHTAKARNLDPASFLESLMGSQN